MKKRQKPILLITMLCVCILTAVGINLYMGGDLKMGAPKKDDHQLTGDARQSESKDDIAKTAKEAMGLKAAPKPPNARKMHPMDEQDNSPKVAIPKMTISKPKPNDSSISGQWYQPDAMKDSSGGK